VAALVFVGGVATASLTLPARAVPVAPVTSAAPPIVVEPPVEIEAEPAAPEAAPIPTIQVEAPVKIRAARKAPPRAAEPKPALVVEAPAAKWVDPFAD
jgi:hypothetical protein